MTRAHSIRRSLFLEQIAVFNQRYRAVLDDAQDELDASSPATSPPRQKTVRATLTQALMAAPYVPPCALPFYA